MNSEKNVGPAALELVRKVQHLSRLGTCVRQSPDSAFDSWRLE